MVFNRFDLEVGVDDRVSNEPRCINYDPEKFILKYLNFFPVGWGCKSPDRCGIGTVQQRILRLPLQDDFTPERGVRQ
ncbi:hypothetical protein AVEN_47828-1 [Araneus ventricosus]|uniref:Uncharacterized protein n=1 Tax=Araneus ventricosus TaxID=182803 RepID=A0A4Y2WFU5_ARAVE|nr:hypothetical protein AVEN_47828-1 [Araneus ventricosus]